MTEGSQIYVTEIEEKNDLTSISVPLNNFSKNLDNTVSI
jgi:hypothetical protein